MIDLSEQRHTVRLISTRVRNFHEMGTDTFRWSCDVCGDSSRDRRKARFYVGRKGQDLLCFCHNCGFSGSLLSYCRISHPDLSEALSVKSFVSHTADSMVDFDALVNRLPNSILQHLFFFSVTPRAAWVERLKREKIVLSKKSFTKLYNLYSSIN